MKVPVKFPGQSFGLLICAVALSACSDNADQASTSSASAPAPAAESSAPAATPAPEPTGATASAGSGIAAALDAQPDEVKARYQYRHPAETLEFFGIKPGMTVVEALPGGGWYSKILVQALGPQGTLIGADYTWEMYPMFNFYSDEVLEAKKTWTTTWPEEANGWAGDAGAEVKAFAFGSMPDSMDGTADAALFIRATHNLARFEDVGAYLTNALSETMRALKPGGIVGVVQHEAPTDADDEWASGPNGYLKKQFVIERFEAAGLEFISESDINQNPKDTAGPGDIVWRLPPNFVGSADDAEKKAKMEAIGESNRMTLLFRKPE